VGKPFRYEASPCDEDDSLAWLEEHKLVEQYLEESRGDNVLGSSPSSLEYMDLILVKAFDLVPTYLTYFLPPLSCACIVPRRF